MFIAVDTVTLMRYYMWWTLIIRRTCLFIVLRTLETCLGCVKYHSHCILPKCSIISCICLMRCIFNGSLITVLLVIILNAKICNSQKPFSQLRVIWYLIFMCGCALRIVAALASIDFMTCCFKFFNQHFLHILVVMYTYILSSS